MADVHRSLDSSSGFPPSRREFVRAAGTATLAASLAAIGPRPVSSAPTPAGPHLPAPAETTVARFYRGLDEEQRRRLCFPFDHPKRSRVGNNWAIVEPAIKDLSREQQALCRDILRNLSSAIGYLRFERQMRDDAGGFENYHVAVFGSPGTATPFEWGEENRHKKKGKRKSNKK